MKILQINKYLYKSGGAETYMFELSKILESHGHEVFYWGTKDERNLTELNLFEENLVNNVDYYTNSIAQRIKHGLNLIYSLEAKEKIRNEIQRVRPDIVHIHNFNFQLTPAILSEIKSFNIPIVHTIHDSQLACPYHRLYSYKKEAVCTDCLNSNFLHAIKNRCFDNSLLKSTLGAAESIIHHSINSYDYIDKFISPSVFFKDIVQTRIKKEIEVLPYCIEDVPSFFSNKKAEYFLYFGRLSAEKGLKQLYEIFDKINLPLVVVGAGEVIPDGNKENISYLGPKYGNDLYKLIGHAKYSIINSKWWDNNPLAVYESLQLGTPVICPDHSGFRELIQDGENGFRVDFEKKDILEVIKNINSKKLNYYSIRTNFLKKYSSENHYSKMIEYYRNLIQSKPS
jgi:glycosyltransferase involved in cell wall biosynthesis